MTEGCWSLRDYRQEDCPGMARLFYDTVHAVNAADYSPDQLSAWAAGEVDLAAWNASFLAHRTIVAETAGVILGFGDMDAAGYLDRLYVHKDYQRQGIATAICDALESGCDGSEFTTHASITAKPFFENRGYTVIRCQQVWRCGVWLTNFGMGKGNRNRH